MRPQVLGAVPTRWPRAGSSCVCADPLPSPFPLFTSRPTAIGYNELRSSPWRIQAAPQLNFPLAYFSEFRAHRND